MITSSPAKFAEWFNEKYPGAYRLITTEDVKDLTTCGLIYLHKCYSGSVDGELIRRILQYEQLRSSRLIEREKEKKPLTCKMCGEPLPSNPEVKSGRYREYCSECEPFRNRERQKRSRLHCRN